MGIDTKEQRIAFVERQIGSLISCLELEHDCVVTKVEAKRREDGYLNFTLSSREAIQYRAELTMHDENVRTYFFRTRADLDKWFNDDLNLKSIASVSICRWDDRRSNAK